MCKVQKRFRKRIAALAAILFASAMFPVTAFSAGEIMLSVDGVDALETSQGDGWSYNSSTKTLTLDGYNGGPIIGKGELTIQLAAGSSNTIQNPSGPGLGESETFSDGLDLTICGESKTDSLTVTGVDYAILTCGNLTIENCTLNANASSVSELTKECIYSERNTAIRNSDVYVSTGGVGIGSFDYVDIQDSYIEIVAGYFGINANNEDLTAENTEFQITAAQGNGLYSYIGGNIHLKKCKGTVTAGVAGIYRNNSKNTDSVHKKIILENCYDLKFLAPYGMMSFGDIEIKNSEVAFPNEGSTGIYAYTEDSSLYTADVKITGESSIDGKENDTVILAPYSTVTIDESAQVKGKIKTEGNDKVIFSGEMTILKDYAAEDDQTIEILNGAEITIPEGIKFDISKAVSVENNGTVLNNGTILLSGEKTENSGNIYNNAVITVVDKAAFTNTGKIQSICTAEFSVEGNEIIWNHNWDEGVITTEPTASSEGIRTYTCKNNQAHTYTETVPKLENQPSKNPDMTDNKTYPVKESGKQEKVGSPVTGDNEQINVWLYFMAAAGIMVIAAITVRRKCR